MKFIYLLITCLLNLSCIAQVSLLEYDVFSNGRKDGETYIVFNELVSISGLPEEINNMKNSIFVKNFKEEILYSTNQFLNITFHLKEPLHTMEWELTEDTLSVLGISCNAAKTNFRGRKYTVFYAPSLPFNNGPGKFGGLPGIILNVKSEDNYVEWIATKINTNYSGRFDIPDLSQYKFDDYEDFVVKYKDAVFKYIQMVQASRSVDSETKNNIKVEQDEIFYPELQTANGITF